MSIATQAPANGTNVPAPRPAAAPARLVVNDNSAASYMMDTAKFEHCYRIAKAMATASLLPDHLVLNMKTKQPLPLEEVVGNCFRLVNQGIRWGMDPFALPDETYVVGHKLGYQGKLVAAVINARAGLAAALSVIYSGATGDNLAAVVFGSRSAIPREAWALLKKYAADEDGEAYTDLMALGVMCIRITVGQAKTDNKMWKNDPQQKLWYSGATKWARRHAPEIILGVMTDDDMERMGSVDAQAFGPAEPLRSIEQLTEHFARPAQAAPPADDAGESTSPPISRETTETTPDYLGAAMAALDNAKTTADITQTVNSLADVQLSPEKDVKLTEATEQARERIKAAGSKPKGALIDKGPAPVK